MYTGSFRLLASFFLLPLTHEPSGNNIALGKGVRVQNSPVVVPKRSFSIASVARKSRVKYLVYLTPSKLPNHLLDRNERNGVATGRPLRRKCVVDGATATALTSPLL
jgi:hypothetical protein